MKIVFMGSPDFAVPSLDALVEARFDVKLVVTQPDRPSGQGRKLLPTAVKTAAAEHNLPVIDFGKGQGKEVTRQVLAVAPDAVVVVAFGQILREPLLSAPPLGCINVHASLLPRWRGVSPVQYSILHGDTWSGVTIMRMDEGVDTGPILSQRAVSISPEDTAGELLDRLAARERTCSSIPCGGCRTVRSNRSPRVTKAPCTRPSLPAPFRPSAGTAMR